MRFIDRTAQKSSTLHGANMLIGNPGPDSGFDATTSFTPRAFVRNNTGQPVTINPLVRYTLHDQANTFSLSPATLVTNEVREINLGPVISAIGSNIVSDSGIEIEHTGGAGAVMAYAASVDQTGSNVFDVPIKDPQAEPFKGGSYPWNIAGENRAVLHVKNVDAPGDGQKREFMAKLYFEGGEYNIALQKMDAGQTVDVDIKKLRDEQITDVLGNVIPLNVTGGQLDWYGRANRGQFIGRLIIYDPVAGAANSFSCVQNCLCTPTYSIGMNGPKSDCGHPRHRVSARCNRSRPRLQSKPIYLRDRQRSILFT